MNEKSEKVSAIFLGVAKALVHIRAEAFTTNDFMRLGVSKSTIDHRLNNLYRVSFEWKRLNATAYKRMYETKSLIEAMKREGDWR